MLTELSRHIFDVFVAVNVSRCPDQYGTDYTEMLHASIFGPGYLFMGLFCSFSRTSPHCAPTYKVSIQSVSYLSPSVSLLESIVTRTHSSVMSTLLSRLPFDTTAFSTHISSYWRASEPSMDPIPAPNTNTVVQSESFVPQSTEDVSPDPEAEGTEEFDFHHPSASNRAADEEADKATGEKVGIAELIAQYGSSSATSWLEFARYKIWRPFVPIPESSFPPVQGYLRSDPFVFAWGNPIVSDPAALEATCAAFIDWAKSQKLRPIWLCVDSQMEQVLGAQGSKFGWSTLTCIVEDFLDPRSVVELAHSHGGGSEVKDFKKNLRRAERESVQVREVKPDQWTDGMKRQVEDGISGWKKSKTGIQIASVS